MKEVKHILSVRVSTIPVTEARMVAIIPLPIKSRQIRRDRTFLFLKCKIKQKQFASHSIGKDVRKTNFCIKQKKKTINSNVSSNLSYYINNRRTIPYA